MWLSLRIKVILTIGFARGVHVMVISGPHIDLYGNVEGIDGDNGRIFVALAINKQVRSSYSPILFI